MYDFNPNDFIPELIKDKKYKKKHSYAGYTIIQPEPPPLQEFINFGKKEKDQYFIHIRKPKNFNKLPFKTAMEFAKRENHRRRNGIFIYIKGYPLWIPGKHYHYLNYWTTENGTQPNFELHDLLFYLVWETVIEKDENCYGLLDLKPRRIGDTEKALHILYEYGSRVRNSRIGMQNKVGDDALENYGRLIIGHRGMHQVFKPINQGSTDPKKHLILKEPEERMTLSKVERDNSKVQQKLFETENTNKKELGTRITWRPSIAKAYDSRRLHRFHLDEWGKMEAKEMSPVECWSFVKPCLHKDGGSKIIGKAIFTTTAEEIEAGESLEFALDLWDGADFNDKNENNRTSNGLYRIFRDAALCTKSDGYGFPLIEENIKRIVNEIVALEKKGKIEEAINFKRKNPLVVEWALTPSANKCRFNGDVLRENQADINSHETPLTVKGDLIWLGGQQDTKVVWVPNPEGKFISSQLLTNEESNQYYLEGPIKKPSNPHKGVIGCDTYDAIETGDDRKSMGALAAFRKFDLVVDGFVNLEDEENDLFQYKTNQFTFTYCNRPEDPDEFYEDAIKLCFYTGYPMLYENNKPGIRKYFMRRGYAGYLMLRPEETKTDVRKGKIEVGAASTTMFIGQYMEALQTYIASFGRLNKHKELTDEWLIFNDKQRTRFDKTVATGFALIGKERQYTPKDIQEESKKVYFRGSKLY